MTFARDIGLGKQLDRMFSHLKQKQRGYAVSAKVMAFLQMIIKGGDRLSDIDVLRADPGLLGLMRMGSIPRPNTLADLARKFRRRDVHRLAEIRICLGVRALAKQKPKRLILDIDSTLVESDMKIAKKTYKGFRGFNPVGGDPGGELNLAAFSLFRPGNEAPQEHNLSLVRKNIRYLKNNLPGRPIYIRSDAAGYSHRLMRYCDEEKGGSSSLAGTPRPSL